MKLMGIRFAAKHALFCEKVSDLLQDHREGIVLLKSADNPDGHHATPCLVPVDLKVRQALIVVYKVRDNQVKDCLVNVKFSLFDLAHIFQLLLNKEVLFLYKSVHLLLNKANDCKPLFLNL